MTRADEAALGAALDKMRRAGVAEAAQEAFRRMFAQLSEPGGGLLPGDRLEPVRDVRRLDQLDTDAGRAELDRAVVVKLNGGLGTSMGLSAPKSLVEVKPGHSFLDVIARQVLALRERQSIRLPLVLMNSFATREPTLEALARHPGIESDVPLDFLQSSAPKLRADDLRPVEWPAEPRLEWAPPGHGDIYAALVGSGTLDELLARGYEYAFVSNADNLGAVLDPRVLALVAGERLPFLMEVVEGTEADRKGGHIARLDGRLVLRETAQVPDGDDSFTDFRRWRYYNTNSLWISLPALAERGGAIELPLIANHKTVDPADASSPEVIQLETAMGAALGAIEGAGALCVPRTRFAPVKTTNDLLVVRSDAYVLDDADGRVEPVGEPPVVELDPRYYKLLSEFDARFPGGPPSLVDAERLTVRGDVTFGAGTVVRGAVEVEG
ncbi:MAG: UTP--glucose-phosphate uridylyltransferase [Thermoleophilaceae bacterium]|nr:UTP--glucose-phosphate uridylyltransferase [Thermoleophilaceae bacterium]